MSQFEPSRLELRPSSVPLLLLTVSLILVLALVGYLLWEARAAQGAHAQNLIQAATEEIEKRVQTGISLIHATRGLYAADEAVSEEEFRDFVRTLNLPRRAPGFDRMGYATASGTVSFVEPRGKFGPELKDPALQRARDDGAAAASNRNESGVLIFAPVYRRGASVATVDQRRAAIEGFIFTSLDIETLIHGVAGEGLALTVTPGTGARSITIAGQPWTLNFRSTATSSGATAPILFFLAAGVAFSGTIFAISRAQVKARSAAERLATRWSKSAAALTRSEDRGRRILESALDAVVGIDLEGRITHWNPKAVEMFGWPEAEALGKLLTETIIPPAYREAHARGLASFKETRHGPALNRRIELSALRRDGTEFPIELSITAIGAGPQTTFSAFVRDLTDRRKAEASLRESLERFRIVAATTTDLIYEWHPGSGLVEWFGDVDRHVGRGPMEFPRTRAAWEELVHPEDRARFARSGPADEAYVGEYRIRKHDGSWRTWTDRAHAIPGPDGTAARWIGSISDVSDRRSLERDRERLLDRLQMQMERMPVACILTGPDYRIRLWNPAAARIFGWSREEAAGRGFDELLLAPEARAQAAAHLKSLAEGRHSSITTWENLARDGRRILCEWHMGPLQEADGTPAGIQAMAIDTTERARLESQLRQSQKMEAVGRLAGGIAHDFNNLLTAVSGYSEILLDELPKEGDARTHVEEIRGAARRAADLTRQLLAFSRKQMLEPTVLDLNAVIADMDKMFRRVLGEDIILAISLGTGLGPVKADRGQVEQVIMNLVVNARDAMPKGGRLTLETRNVELDATYAADREDAKAGPHVLLAVSDTGAGIPSEVLPRIFEPFFTTKERGKGTGLGLATVYGIVKQSGGHVAAYSEPGRGATFKVYLARIEGKPKERATAARVKPAAGGTETILVVEDEAPVRKLLTQVLKRQGYTVLDAASGLEALQAIAAHGGPIHLMVTDVVMPGMSGRDLARRVAPLRPEAKVLYISGYTEDAIVNHGELEPGTAFLSKPFTPAALATKVREVLG
jgi:two-component system cell cycle sensor histidine kinase/response regulator CckA